MSAEVRQLSVKGIRWMVSLVVSAFLTWTTLNYFMQPKEVLCSLRRLRAAFVPAGIKAAVKSFYRKTVNNTLLRILNPIA